MLWDTKWFSLFWSSSTRHLKSISLSYPSWRFDSDPNEHGQETSHERACERFGIHDCWFLMFVMRAPCFLSCRVWVTYSCKSDRVVRWEVGIYSLWSLCLCMTRFWKGYNLPGFQLRLFSITFHRSLVIPWGYHEVVDLKAFTDTMGQVLPRCRHAETTWHDDIDMLYSSIKTSVSSVFPSLPGFPA